MSESTKTNVQKVAFNEWVMPFLSMTLIFICLTLAKIQWQLEKQTAMMEQFMNNIEVLELPEETTTEQMELVKK
jgi:hypothetical protein